MKNEWTKPAMDAFEELLRCSISNTSPDTGAFGSLGINDWELVYRFVKKHAVIGTCFFVVEKLPDVLKPHRNLYLKWCGMALHIQKSNQHIRQVYKQMNEWFEKEGVYPILLKGLGIAGWYPQPLLRVSSDIDIYVNPGQYAAAVNLIQRAGMSLKQTPEHDEFMFQGVQIELHTHTSHYGSIFEAEPIGEIVSDGEIKLRIPSVAANALLLIKHPSKHIFTTGSSIRHLCDWAVFLQRNHERIPYLKIEEALKRERLENFAYIFTSLTADFLKLNLSAVPCGWMNKGKKRQKQILLNDLMERGDCGMVVSHRRIAMNNLSFSWEYCRKWGAYYWGAFFRLLRLSSLFPDIIYKMLLERVGHRLKCLVMGRPFAGG